MAAVAESVFMELQLCLGLRLSSRTQAITINSLQSQHAALCYGFPQGSVLGPALFIIDIQPLFDLVSKRAVNTIIMLSQMTTNPIRLVH